MFAIAKAHTVVPRLGYRLAVRHLACASVIVDFKTVKTSINDLHRVFNQVGNVWDILPIESKLSGRPLYQAVVRFYDGKHYTGDTPDSAPVLPPPTDAESRRVAEMVDAAVLRLDRALINGFKIKVSPCNNNSPSQLHEWYEKMHLEKAKAHRKQQADLFPVNPFAEPPRLPDDDYQAGFMAGFKLGLKDGSKTRQ
ncbi:hypothetical protein GGI07_005780 [Coemansia sp. Benny D115]|nr:hypothetical protein GGI07_005780 [Coemansia sp. Benny D115]